VRVEIKSMTQFRHRVFIYAFWLALLSTTPTYADIREEVEAVASRHSLTQTPTMQNIAQNLADFSAGIQTQSLAPNSRLAGFVVEDKEGHRSFFFDLLQSGYESEIAFGELAFTDYDAEVRVLYSHEFPVLKIFFKDGSVLNFQTSSLTPEDLAQLRHCFLNDFLEINFPWQKGLTSYSVQKNTFLTHEMGPVFELLGSQLTLGIGSVHFRFLARESQFLIQSPSSLSQDFSPLPIQTPLSPTKSSSRMEHDMEILNAEATLELLKITAPLRGIMSRSKDDALSEAETELKQLRERKARLKGLL
jgi:hypothetical protein